MTDGFLAPELRVPAAGRLPALTLRPWRAADISALAAEMSREYLNRWNVVQARRPPRAD